MLAVGIRCICVLSATGSSTSCGSNTASLRRSPVVWRCSMSCSLLSGRCSELRRRTHSVSLSVFPMSSRGFCQEKIFFQHLFKIKVSGQKVAAAQDNQKGCLLFNLAFSLFQLCIQKLITVKCGRNIC